MSRPNDVSRRQFTASVVGAAAVGVFSSTAVKASRSSTEKLAIASVGAGGRAADDIAGVASEDIVALCDVDSRRLEEAGAKYGSAERFVDYREMIASLGDRVDAVVVGTPDHTHAVAAAAALRAGKHVYCEKPLTHTVFEARRLTELARERGLVTQMGTQIHAGGNYRRVVELVQSGAIGPVREVHVWSSSRYDGGRFQPAPRPPQLEWDLWQGPVAEREYSEGLHPFNWRRFWDYGSGSLGDFGCHYMDLAHWALDLAGPTRVSSVGPEVDDVSAPAWCIVTYDYPARRGAPPVRLTWYDGGRRPQLLAQLRDGEGNPLNWDSGQLFVGSEGMILSNYGQHILLPAGKFADFTPPPQTIPDSIGHHAEWLAAIRANDPSATTCRFDYAGPLTEAVLLGKLAYRTGRLLEWDSAAFKITNAPDLQPLLHKEYREGWTL